MWNRREKTGNRREGEREFSGNHGTFSIPRDVIMENKVYLGLEKKTKQQHGETAQVQQISLLIIISMFAFMTASDVSKSYCSCRGEMFSLWRLDFAWLWFLCRCNRLENLTWRHLWSFFFLLFWHFFTLEKVKLLLWSGHGGLNIGTALTHTRWFLIPSTEPGTDHR